MFEKSSKKKNRPIHTATNVIEKVKAIPVKMTISSCRTCFGNPNDCAPNLKI